MSFNFKRFCEENSVQYLTEGHKHCRPNWIQVPCPFCVGNAGWHLGFESAKDRFVCWRCGGHHHVQVIAGLLSISKWKAKKLWKQYKGRPVLRQADIAPRIANRKVKLPPGLGALSKVHRSYLIGRKFNPDELTKIWRLKATGPIGPYKFRIIAPIFFEGQLISFQGRDITDKHDLKYKACAQKYEVMDHKHVLYGFDLAERDSIVIVEGIADAWRLGPGAVATFGIKYKPAQVRLMKSFKNRFILFDTTDPQAVIQSKKLANELSAYQGSTEIIEIEADDPGSMKQKDADALMKDLIS